MSKHVAAVKVKELELDASARRYWWRRPAY